LYVVVGENWYYKPGVAEQRTDRAEREVPDPFYGGSEGFEHVLDLVEEASEGLLEDIRRRYLQGGRAS
jgi:protein-tyrosine-phosphatase